MRILSYRASGLEGSFKGSVTVSTRFLQGSITAAL